jgi:hypothetical protein
MSSPARRVFRVSWKTAPAAGPRRTRGPEDVCLRENIGRRVQRSCGNYDFSAAAREVWQGSAARCADSCREALSAREIKTLRQMFPGHPRKLGRRNIEVRGMRGTGSLATAATIAMRESQIGLADFVRHRAAKA